MKHILESVADKKDLKISERRDFERANAIKMAAVLSKPCPLPKYQSTFYLTMTINFY